MRAIGLAVGDRGVILESIADDEGEEAAATADVRMQMADAKARFFAGRR